MLNLVPTTMTTYFRMKDTLVYLLLLKIYLMLPGGMIKKHPTALGIQLKTNGGKRQFLKLYCYNILLEICSYSREN